MHVCPDENHGSAAAASRFYFFVSYFALFVVARGAARPLTLGANFAHKERAMPPPLAAGAVVLEQLDEMRRHFVAMGFLPTIRDLDTDTASASLKFQYDAAKALVEISSQDDTL